MDCPTNTLLPCGLHVSPEGNGQAHRRGSDLRTRQLVAGKSLRLSERHVLRTGRGGLVRRRPTSTINRARMDLYCKGE